MRYTRTIATPVSEPPPSGRLSWVVAGLALALFWLRLERAWLAEATLSAWQWLQWLGPELGLVGALAGSFAFFPPRPLSRWLQFAAAMFVFGCSVVAAQYFAHAGTPLDRRLVVYAVTHRESLGGLLASGIDHDLLLRAFLGITILGGALRFDRRYPWRWNLRPRAAALTVALGLGVYGVSLPRGASFPGRHALALEPVTGTVAASFARPSDPDTLYFAPVVKGTRLTSPPNLLVIFLESTRRDVIPPYGPPESASVAPFLASVADQAVVVENAYVTTSHTSKALVGTLCGLHPHPRMAVTEPFHLPARCLPELLRAAGYRTAFFQSALGSFEDRRKLVTRMGFEHVLTQEDLATANFSTVGYVAMDERAMVDPIVSFVRDSSAPYFAVALTSVPHHPYETPGPVPSQATEGSEIAYATAIHHVDAFIAELFDRLKAIPGWEDTVVMVLADHGEAFGDHQRRQHDAVPYEEVVAVPWLLLGRPLASRPRSITGLRSHLDLVPTALELAGVEWTGTLPGRSLLSTPGHRAVFTACWFDQYCAAVRTGHRKIVFHFDRQDMEEFDLERDPDETNPRLLSPSQAQLWANRILNLHSTVKAIYSRDAPSHLSVPPPTPLTRPQCMRACVADTDPATPGLQYACTVTEVEPDGTHQPVRHCGPPSAPGATPCFYGRVDRDLPAFCARKGFNLELRIHRIDPPRPGAVIDAKCQLASDPSVQCDPSRLLGLEPAGPTG